MKTGLNKPKYSLGEAPTKDKQKYSRWNLSADSGCCRSTGPVDRQGRISDRWESGRPGGRPKSQTESSALSAGRLSRSTEVHNAHWCMSVDRSVDRQSSSALPAVDRSGRPDKAKKQDFERLLEVFNFSVNFV